MAQGSKQVTRAAVEFYGALLLAEMLFLASERLVGCGERPGVGEARSVLQFGDFLCRKESLGFSCVLLTKRVLILNLLV